MKETDGTSTALELKRKSKRLSQVIGSVILSSFIGSNFQKPPAQSGGYIGGTVLYHVFATDTAWNYPRGEFPIALFFYKQGENAAEES